MTSAPEGKERPVGRSRRQSSRVLVHILVELRDAEGNAYQGVASDLSITGMFVFTPTTFPIGASVVIQLQLPGLPKSSEIEARVRWLKEGGVGLQFGLLGAADTHAMVKIIEQAKAAHGAT